jgi:hypothetical protein
MARSYSKLAKALFILVLVTLVASALYSLMRLSAAPAQPRPGVDYQKLKSDYTLMLVECILGIVVMFLPSLVERRWHIAIPSLMYAAFVVFLYAAIYLGEIRSFYYRVANWDTILHGFSGLMLGSLGFSVVQLLNDLEKFRIRMSSLFVAFFAFLFAVGLGVVWEIYEYSFDGMLGLNMQKFALDDGRLLAGRAALQDTMEDLIVDSLSALVAAIFGYLSIRRDPKWIKRITIRVRRRGDIREPGQSGDF